MSALRNYKWLIPIKCVVGSGGLQDFSVSPGSGSQNLRKSLRKNLSMSLTILWHIYVIVGTEFYRILFRQNVYRHAAS